MPPRRQISSTVPPVSSWTCVDSNSSPEVKGEISETKFQSLAVRRTPKLLHGHFLENVDPHIRLELKPVLIGVFVVRHVGVHRFDHSRLLHMSFFNRVPISPEQDHLVVPSWSLGPKAALVDLHTLD